MPRRLPSYGLNGSRLPMSTFDDTARNRGGRRLAWTRTRSGGRNGHGAKDRRILSQECSARFPTANLTRVRPGKRRWPGRLSIATILVALIDCNGIQADGPVTVKIEPVADKFTGFGWTTEEVNGNDMAQARRRARPDARKGLEAQSDCHAHDAWLWGPIANEARTCAFRSRRQ